MTRKKNNSLSDIDTNTKYLNRIQNDLDSIDEIIARIDDSISCLDFNHLHQELVVRDIKSKLNSIRQAINYKWDI